MFPSLPSYRFFPAAAMLVALVATGTEPTLPGTAPLTWDGDIASRMVDSADRFLLRQLEQSVSAREHNWPARGAATKDYQQALTAYRARLAYILGVADPRVEFDDLELVATLSRPARIASGTGYDVFRVRWPAVRNLHGEGLLLTPTTGGPTPGVIALPDADQTPEMIVGLSPGVPPESQFARRLAENGCTVLVPVLISREMKPRNGRAVLTNREYLYRSSFELGRHIIGYELQKVLAGVDWMDQSDAIGEKIGVIGWGEGGMLALYAGALDTRLSAVGICGYFNSRQRIWQEPIDRNVFGLLEQFGDAELAAMIAPRSVIVEACRGPELELPGKGGAPAVLTTPRLDVVREEVARAQRLSGQEIELVEVNRGQGDFGSTETLQRLLKRLGLDGAVRNSGDLPRKSTGLPDAAARQHRQVQEIDEHNQWLLVESPYVRQDFMSKLDTSSLDAYKKTIEWYRDYFRTEVVGDFGLSPLPFNPRTRLAYEKEKWTGYEVVLDVFPDVIAYGILLIPKGIREGERRPVVVCQHGLEGRPQEVVDGDHHAYHDFAARLAEQGFVTFAPQNLYLFKDRFRTLQRKAYPLKKTIFSIMVPQHQQIVDWLQTLPFVDGQRIAFYGLSYGGKSAMRIPPLVQDYCLSICSGDFNEWVWKNASTRCRYSYVWTPEYEIFEFDLGSTFNYAEMAALIAPRPFMVERGHFDGVSSDEAVAYEFAKVRHLYSAKLGIGDRCEIEWFAGPHMINGRGTFDFLHRHLQWPNR